MLFQLAFVALGLNECAPRVNCDAAGPASTCCNALSSIAATATGAAAPTTMMGAVQSLKCAGATCNIVAATSSSSTSAASAGSTIPIRLIFRSPTVVRLWAAFDGNFSNNGMEDSVIMPVSDTAKPPVATAADKGTHWEVSVSGSTLVVSVTKSPHMLVSYAWSGATVVAETAPLSWNSTTTWQTTSASGVAGAHYFGGGMQNGRWIHDGASVTIGKDFNWANKGHPNSVPWYLAAGSAAVPSYGALRCTWAPGRYDFPVSSTSDGANTVVAAHNESTRFDVYYVFSGTGVKALLGELAGLTGAPFLPPLYGLGLGDSDCYHNNRHGNSTQVAISIADEYVANDIPVGWMLVNDGYGCGYGEGDAKFPSNLTDLTYVFSELRKRGLYGGLWTSTGMPNIVGEVKTAGSRVCKTDVGWIGAGYKFAFDGVELCAGGIENNSDARRFIWTVEGWAGTHRNAVMWTGDDSGSWEYIRWQLPTFVGCGYSVQAHVSGDIDGIFGGSPDTYVRDLQFKTMMTTTMVMSGWASNPDKQPWTYGEPYLSINRKYLKLKMRMTPYTYTLSREATDTGVPPVRGMALEFPADERLYINSTATSYQFMLGPSLLVAPVYTDTSVRDGIFLPSEPYDASTPKTSGPTPWFDFWSGAMMAGNMTYDNFSAPLDTLPLFVRGGAIIPLWPLGMNYFDEVKHDPISLELWPHGNTSFTLYEDDGVTREALSKVVADQAWRKTQIDVVAPLNFVAGKGPGYVGGKNATVSIGAATGKGFAGMLEARKWHLNIRCKTAPLDVVVVTSATGAENILTEAGSVAQLDALERTGAGGWFHDKVEQSGAGGVLMIRVPTTAATEAFDVVLSAGRAYRHIIAETCDTVKHHQTLPQLFDYDKTTKQITLRPAPPVMTTTLAAAPAASLCITVGKDKEAASGTPAVELQPCAASTDKKVFPLQQWNIAAKASGGQITSVGTGACIDLDGTDHGLEMYSCHSPTSAGNQGWSFNDGGSGHVASTGSSDLCWAAAKVN